MMSGRIRKCCPERHPLIMKVLAALRHLATGDDYQSLEDAARLSASLLKKFIPVFIRWLARNEFARLVRLPEGQSLRQNLSIYKRLGFPGAFCETDGVHLHWDCCPEKWAARFIGKEGYPTIAFNVSVTHNREIILVSVACTHFIKLIKDRDVKDRGPGFKTISQRKKLKPWLCNSIIRFQHESNSNNRRKKPNDNNRRKKL